MDLHNYLIDDADIDWSVTLDEWSWLLPADFQVWLLSHAGDLFISGANGSVHMLDVGAGELRRIAESSDEFSALIDNTEVAKDWFMIPVVDQLRASGARLGPGQCYSYRTLPTLGGSYAADNRMVFGIREHFGGWGSVQRQISILPDGSQVIINPEA